MADLNQDLSMPHTKKLGSVLKRVCQFAAGKGWILSIVVALLSLAYSTVYAGVQNDWWMDDDPALFAIASKVGSPFGFFYTCFQIDH